MGAKTASRRRHRRLHHTHVGSTHRATKYVIREIKRMLLSGSTPIHLRGFRVHPEFGWCKSALERLGLTMISCNPYRRKARDLVPLK